ncbi:hypothetical protein [Aeromicrobium massiliense]|uniref:hypothetical protein n=1 Tax=Aeromicrobium massiliense TaxID=1464554 RepID=UPI000312D004|nr:hypothetical protein [Aeromicrobium massiliense]
MSSPSPNPYRSPTVWGFTVLAAFLLVIGGFVLGDAVEALEVVDGGYLLGAAILLTAGVLSLVVAAATLGTRLALVEHEQSSVVGQPTPAPSRLTTAP